MSSDDELGLGWLDVLSEAIESDKYSYNAQKYNDSNFDFSADLYPAVLPSNDPNITEKLNNGNLNIAEDNEVSSIYSDSLCNHLRKSDDQNHCTNEESDFQLDYSSTLSTLQLLGNARYSLPELIESDDTEYSSELDVLKGTEFCHYNIESVYENNGNDGYNDGDNDNGYTSDIAPTFPCSVSSSLPTRDTISCHNERFVDSVNITTTAVPISPSLSPSSSSVSVTVLATSPSLSLSSDSPNKPVHTVHGRELVQSEKRDREKGSVRERNEGTIPIVSLDSVKGGLSVHRSKILPQIDYTSSLTLYSALSLSSSALSLSSSMLSLGSTFFLSSSSLFLSLPVVSTVSGFASESARYTADRTTQLIEKCVTDLNSDSPEIMYLSGIHDTDWCSDIPLNRTFLPTVCWYERQLLLLTRGKYVSVTMTSRDEREREKEERERRERERREEEGEGDKIEREKEKESVKERVTVRATPVEINEREREREREKEREKEMGKYRNKL